MINDAVVVKFKNLNVEFRNDHGLIVSCLDYSGIVSLWQESRKGVVDCWQTDLRERLTTDLK